MIGSCGLHVVHGAFKDGYISTNWNIHSLLANLYWLFKDSPARREDLIEATGLTLFPLKFCAHRWVENVLVAERAAQVWPYVTAFAAKIQNKEFVRPKAHSFEFIEGT